MSATILTMKPTHIPPTYNKTFLLQEKMFSRKQVLFLHLQIDITSVTLSNKLFFLTTVLGITISVVVVKAFSLYFYVLCYLHIATGFNVRL